MAPSTQVSQLIRLYRQIQRASRQFSREEFRAYFCRCASEDFRQVMTELNDPSNLLSDQKIQDFQSKMIDHLGILQRQSQINQLYHQQNVVVRR